VYLSDKDSVLKSGEADDVLRWLRAVNAPLDGMLARAALATASAGLPLATLIELASDDLAWEQRVDQLKELQRIWQRQGVLAMLRQFLHWLDLPARLLNQPGGERSLTNLLHLAELLQAASLQLDGEQALIRWLAEQIESDSAGGDERILRLESDAELVKVVTVHKSKGLEYPLVFLPFAVSARPVDKLNRHYLELAEAGARRLDFTLADDKLNEADQARLAEDLRLMYVALTRARHALWLGVAAIAKRAKDSNKLHESALGYLLGGGDLLTMEMVAARLELLKQQCPAIELEAAAPADTRTLLTRVEQLPELRPAPEYRASFEKQWSVGSFTALTKDLPAPHVPLHSAQQKLLEIEALPGPVLPEVASEEAPWHRFPRGALAGNFLHEQLEWLAGQGFDAIDEPNFDTRLAKRCEHSGWGHRQTDVITWLRALAATPLPPLGAALCELTTHVPEMEFWLPSQGLNAVLLDRLCRQYLLDNTARPPLPERALTGMLKGYADLVFEHDGRYWVLDYKSNALGESDGDYHQAALAGGMAGHRYDVQAAIYMLALHRLLKSRLGEQYDPARQFGGAIFLFLRGIGSPGRGCYLVPPSLPLLEALDAMLIGAVQTESAGAASR
jgi:exodeoxyribonuclease V beta subunit